VGICFPCWVGELLIIKDSLKLILILERVKMRKSVSRYVAVDIGPEVNFRCGDLYLLKVKSF